MKRLLGIGKIIGFNCALSFLFTGCFHKSSVWQPHYTIHRDVFPNHLTVLFVEDHSVPIVSYTTWFKVGSSWERPSKTGIAHLFEHMMFKGTSRYPGSAFFNHLERKGAVVNAFTQRDATTYYEVISSENLELVIDMESDRLAHLVLTQKDLDAERQVVKEERRLRVDSQFTSQQMEVLQKLAFPHHPYGWPVIGYQEDLDHLSLQECQDFFNRYYQPGNMIIVIAGDFQYDQAKKWIDKYYSPIKGHSLEELKLKDEKLSGFEKQEEIVRPVEAESILIGYYIPSLYNQDSEKLSMLAWALFDMNSSRIHEKLVREKQLALGVLAHANLERFPNLFLISIEMRTGQSSHAIMSELDHMIEEAGHSLLSFEEVQRVKNRLTYEMINEAKSPEGFARWLVHGEFYWKDPEHFLKTLGSYQSIQPKDLQEMVKKYLKKENRVVVFMKPEKREWKHD